MVAVLRSADWRDAGPDRAAEREMVVLYRRRRLLVGGLALLAVAAVLIVAQLIRAGIGGGPLTTTDAAATTMSRASVTEYVVQPGDTVWGIAATLAPGRDERPLVDQLVRQIGSSSIYPGEVIRLNLPA
jgi:hypothetical protein